MSLSKIEPVDHDVEEWTNDRIRYIESYLEEVGHLLVDHKKREDGGHTLGAHFGEETRDNPKTTKCLNYVKSMHSEMKQRNVTSRYTPHFHPANHWIFYGTLFCTAIIGFIIIVIFLLWIF